MALPELKDAIGNVLHKGDLVFVDTTNKITIGEVVSVHQGGIAPGPAVVTIMARIEIPARPGDAVTGLLALRHPTKANQQELVQA